MEPQIRTAHPDLARVRDRLLPRLQAPHQPGGLLDWVPGKLSVALTTDTRDGPQPVDVADLERWHETAQGLMATALENLRRRSQADSWYPLQTVPGLSVYLAHDGLAASRLLLLPEMLDRWPLGGVVSAVPTPDQLFVLPIEHLDDVSALQTLVQSSTMAHAMGDFPLSDQIFWCDDRGWRHVQVEHGPDTLEIIPPPEFLDRVRQIAALSLVRTVGEG